MLDRLTAGGADLVKVYLLGSERYEAGGGADTGLDPALVPVIVRGAHARGLPVVAHLETAADLRVAVEAGVDVAGHLPGYGGVGEGGPEAYGSRPTSRGASPPPA